MPMIRTSKDAYEIFMKSWDKGLIEFLEEFKILLLKRSNKVIGLYPVSLGGASGTVVDLRPSEQDLRLTKQLKEAGRLLHIEVLDHLIFSSEGLLFFWR